MYLPFDKYKEKWQEISDLFSKGAVRSGSLDAAMVSKKKGSLPVDKAFLSQIEGWRETLAKNIHQLNPSLNRWDLNYAVQATIDRIVFLRVCEDRGVEEYGKLERLLEEPDVYEQLCGLFREADSRYNSGLFHFSKDEERGYPDDLTPELGIEDETLKEIIRDLYYPRSPYQFSVMPVEILGQTYEQFLGRVISIEDSGEVSVEEKPEVRKAGGVYYTPTYIVDYIVENTVGKLVKGKTPRQVSNLKIVDPACGSGSFLLGAYEYLLKWHLRWYVENGPEKHPKAVFEHKYRTDEEDIVTEWRLRIGEKKNILTNNIYGVDIDDQAVEVTKLSLLLKVLEGETADSMESQLSLLNERVLPYLGKNIQSGNSLIGYDFYESEQLGLLDEEEERRINTFDWHTAFPEVFSDKDRKKNPGFDAVIGNPPWISLSGKFGAEIYRRDEIEYLVNHFQGNTYMPNMYEYFVSQGLNLVRDMGYFSFVVPDRLGFNKQFVQLRKRILLEAQVISLLYRVPFPGVTADTVIFVFLKGSWPESDAAYISEYDSDGIQRYRNELLQDPTHTFEYFEDLRVMQLVRKLDSLSNVHPVSALCDSTSGFGGKSKLMQRKKTTPSQIPTLKGNSIGRYEMREGYWFEFKSENITGRTTDPSKLGASPKILLRKTGNRIIATYEESGVFPEQSLYFLYNNATEMDLMYFLGVLNSKLIDAYYKTRSLTNRKSIAQVKKVDLDKLPIRTIDSSDAEDAARHDRMVTLVQQMMELQKQLAEEKVPQNKNRLQQRIDWTDREIDKLVYELYGLSDEEISIVEGTPAEL